MHVDDDHRHYGSALIQIAEDPHFTAINAFRYRGRNSRCGFRINEDIGVYIRYRSKPKGQRWPAYSFVFNHDNLAELRRMHRQHDRLFLALVCVKDREICCFTYADFKEMVTARRADVGRREEEYVIDVWAPAGKRLRAWILAPNTKGRYSKECIIPRNDFPRVLFRRRSGISASQQ